VDPRQQAVLLRFQQRLQRLTLPLKLLSCASDHLELLGLFRKDLCHILDDAFSLFFLVLELLQIFLHNIKIFLLLHIYLDGLLNLCLDRVHGVLLLDQLLGPSALVDFQVFNILLFKFLGLQILPQLPLKWLQIVLVHLLVFGEFLRFQLALFLFGIEMLLDLSLFLL